MGVQRLVINDLEEEDFLLVGIHCSLPAYGMAFLLNKHIGMLLERRRIDLQLYDREGEFQLYHWYNGLEDVDWHLIANAHRRRIERTQTPRTLFEIGNSEEITTFLLPEKRSVDYFLKGSQYSKGFKKLLAKINDIPQVVTAYHIQTDQLKSKNHLIF